MTRSKSIASIVASNIVGVLNLPEEPAAGYHGLPGGNLGDQLNNAGYFELVGYCNNEHPECEDRKCDTKIYTKREIAMEIEDEIEKPNTLPCGHAGIHNIRNGRGYTCRKRSCGKRFDKETVDKTFFATEGD